MDKLANEMGRRSACIRTHWANVLNPELKKDPWESEEERILCAACRKAEAMGVKPNYADIGQKLCKSRISVRGRWV